MKTINQQHEIGFSPDTHKLDKHGNMLRVSDRVKYATNFGTIKRVPGGFAINWEGKQTNHLNSILQVWPSEWLEKVECYHSEFSDATDGSASCDDCGLEVAGSAA